MHSIGSATSQGAQRASQSIGDNLSVSMLKKANDQAKQEGEAAVSLIESTGEARRGASEPGLGRGVDVSG